VQRPEDQSPFRNPAQARARRATALRRMQAAGYITGAERKAAEAEPLPSTPFLAESIVGPYFCEEVRQYLEKTYGEKDLYRRGLRIESTLDPELQAWSEESLAWGLRQIARRHGFRKPRNLAAEGYSSLESYVDPSWEAARIQEDAALTGVVTRVGPGGAEVRIGKQTLPLPNQGVAWTGTPSAAKLLKAGDLVTVTVQKGKNGALSLLLDQEPREQGAVVILENSSGAVRAMVGGSDWSASKFNRATQALRQAGSAFKPFVYLTALEQGYTAADTVFDGPVSIVIDPRQPPYRPSNYDNKFHGIVTFRKALEHSYNIPAVRVAQMVGLSNVIDTAHRLGVKEDLGAYPSLALGAFEVSLLELTSAYTVFANQGLAFTPYLVERITDSNGDVLEQTHPEAREVESPHAAFQLLQILRGVTQRGTAASAARLQLNIAGKTGTTNDFTDAWFVGMTPRYTVGVWVGNDKKTQSIGKGADGARVALPIWIRILERMKDQGRIDPQEDFEAPPNIVFTPVDYETGLKATPDSPLPVLDAFVSGSQPTEEWNVRSRRSRSFWSLQQPFYVPKKGETEGGPVPRPRRPPAERRMGGGALGGRRRVGSLHVDGQRRDDVAVQPNVDRVRAEPANRLRELDAPAIDLDAARRERVGDLGGRDRPVEVTLFAGLLGDDDCLPLDLAGDLVGDRLLLKRLLVVLLLLFREPAHVGDVGLVSGALRKEEIARVPRLDRHRVPAMPEAADVVGQYDLHDFSVTPSPRRRKSTYQSKSPRSATPTLIGK
jgi:penicillin-binding protein 1A